MQWSCSYWNKLIPKITTRGQKCPKFRPHGLWMLPTYYTHVWQQWTRTCSSSMFYCWFFAMISQWHFILRLGSKASASFVTSKANETTDCGHTCSVVRPRESAPYDNCFWDIFFGNYKNNSETLENACLRRSNIFVLLLHTTIL